MRKTQPDPAGRVGQNRQWRCPHIQYRPVLEAGPGAFGQTKYAGNVQRDPQCVVPVLGNRLNTGSFDLRRQFRNFNHVIVNHAPNATGSAQPDHAVRVAMRAGDRRRQRLDRHHLILKTHQRPVLGAGPDNAPVAGSQRKIVGAAGKYGRPKIVMTKSVQAAAGAEPDISFSVLENRPDIVGRKTVFLRECLGEFAVRRNRAALEAIRERQSTDTVARTANPQAPVAIKQDTRRGQLKLRIAGRQVGRQGGERKRTYRSIGARYPYRAIRSLGDMALPARMSRGAMEATLSRRQKGHAFVRRDPERAFPITVHRPCTFSRIAPVIADTFPARPLQTDQPLESRRPDDPRPVFRKAEHGACREAIFPQVIAEPAVVEKTRGAVAESDPQTT